MVSIQHRHAQQRGPLGERNLQNQSHRLIGRFVQGHTAGDSKWQVRTHYLPARSHVVCWDPVFNIWSSFRSLRPGRPCLSSKHGNFGQRHGRNHRWRCHQFFVAELRSIWQHADLRTGSLRGSPYSASAIEQRKIRLYQRNHCQSQWVCQLHGDVSSYN